MSESCSKGITQTFTAVTTKNTLICCQNRDQLLDCNIFFCGLGRLGSLLFLDHTLGMTPMDEEPVRRRDDYLHDTQHNTRHPSLRPAQFVFVIPSLVLSL
jgi:hypothetical protein